MKSYMKKSLGIGASLLGIATSLTYSFYQRVFIVDRKRITDPHKMPKGKQFEEVKEKSIALVDQALKISYEDVYIQSEDGLRLHARYYEKDQKAPVQILFHGYRSMPVRDFCGGLQLALEMGHNVLLVDQRAHGESEGKCLTFGIMEQKDCKSWVRYVQKEFGEKHPVILVGMSMGASTVLMAADKYLPGNVVGIIADSGYTSPKDIICKVVRDMHFIPAISYPLTSAAARIWGGFSLEECSAEEVLRHCQVPVLLLHGEADRFVPCEMSRRNYESCTSPKMLVTIPNAGHGLGYMIDYDAYTGGIQEFLEKKVYPYAEEHQIIV